MLSLGRFPWVSLALMFVSYAMIGGLLAEGHYSPSVTVFIIIGSVMVAGIYLHPLTDLSRFLKHWFASDAVAFCVLISIAAFASILLNWFKLFMPGVMILASEGLARLDLQAGEYSEAHAFLLLLLTTMMGLGFGWGLGRV